MKKLTLILLLAILCVSCKRMPQYPTELLRIDSLCYSNPDSALIQLESLAYKMPESEESVRNYFQLLMVKAHDKAYHKHTTASGILSVLPYYEKKGDPRLLPEAYYYAGRVMRDLGDAPQALDYFQKGLEAIQSQDKQQIPDNEICNTNTLKFVIYLQTGYLLNSQQLHDEAIESFKLAYSVSELMSDTAMMIVVLGDLGQAYEAEGNDEEALNYFVNAEQLANSTGDKKNLSSILCHEALVLTQLGRDHEAQNKLSLVSEVLIPKHLLSKYYLVNAYYYSETGQIDSALYYYDRLSVYGNAEARIHAKLWFANQAVAQNRPSDAIEYLRQYLSETNEISKNSNAEAIALAHSLYNYQLRERENNQLKLRNAKIRIYLTIAITSAILLIAVFLFMLKIQSQKREKAQQQFLHLQLQQKQKELESEQTIQKNTQRIQALEAKITATSSEKDTLQKELEALKLATQHAELGKQRNQIFRQLLDVAPITFLINERELENKILSAEDWEKIEDFFKANNPDFVSILLSLHTFTTIEWHVTLLVKLGFNPKSIGVLIPTSQSSVSSIRRRLFEKIFKKKGNSSDWDDFICDL